MKRCAYCGRENENDAVHCRECGTTEFDGSPTTAVATPDEPLVLQCDHCGATTDIAEGFFKEQKSSSDGGLTLCPVCWHKHKISLYKKRLILPLALGLSGLVCLFLLPDEGITWLSLNIFIFYAALSLSILPHELGHAFTAKYLGWRVFRIFIGYGKTVFKMKLFGFDTEFHAIPMGGRVVETPRETNHYRSQRFALVIAGPLANVLLLLVLFITGGRTTIDFAVISKHLAPFQMFFIANVLIVVENLWPRFHQTPLGKLPSDGKQLLQLLKVDSTRAAQSHASWFLLEAVVCQEKGQYAEALSWLEKGLKLYPNEVQLLTSFGTNLLSLARFNEARECFLKVLPRTDQDRLLHSVLLNNIAYADALIGGPELLAEADRYSAEAMKNLSWMPSIKGTRGTVLSELGKLDEAVPLLREVMLTHEVPHNRAQNACLLAIAEARRGDLDAAQKYLKDARELDSTCFLLERAQNFLNGSKSTI